MSAELQNDLQESVHVKGHGHVVCQKHVVIGERLHWKIEWCLIGDNGVDEISECQGGLY
jgi:hypothetical protein